jgi:predicted nucleotidyltransferase
VTYGLLEQDIAFIVKALSQYPEIEKAVLFGSRAKGNYKAGSDIDLAVMGDKINFDTISRLHAFLEEQSPMPYFFDIIDYTHLEHLELKEHIGRVGKVIYNKS